MSEVATIDPVEELEGKLMEMQRGGTFLPVECPLQHLFPPQQYLRVIEMPAGIVVVGKEHLTRHANAVLTGRATVSMNGKVVELKAGDVFISEAGTRKVLLIHERMKFLTVHPNPDNITDVEVLEGMFVKSSETLLNYEREIRELMEFTHTPALEIGGNP